MVVILFLVNKRRYDCMRSNNITDINNQVKPKILPLPNGPYYLINDMQPKVVDNVKNFKGEPLSQH